MKHKRKPITSREMEAAYRLCLERERIRERDWRETKQGAFESQILHFDMEAEEALERQNSVSWLTDRGRGAREIYNPRTAEARQKRREKCINKAKQLVLRNAKDCSAVFWLIIKNESNREESICQLARIASAREAKKSSLKRAPKRPSTGTR